MKTINIHFDHNDFRYYRQEDGSYRIETYFEDVYYAENDNKIYCIGIGNTLMEAISDTFKKISILVWNMVEKKYKYLRQFFYSDYNILKTMEEGDQIHFEFVLIDGDQERKEIEEEKEEERRNNAGRWKKLAYTLMFCFRCEKKISDDDPCKNWNTNNATDFYGTPGYGSCYDHSGGENINKYCVFICDDCLSKHKNFVRGVKKVPNETGSDENRYCEITNDSQLGGYDITDEAHEQRMKEHQEYLERQKNKK